MTTLRRRSTLLPLLVAAASCLACAGVRHPEPPAPAPRAREDVVRDALAAVVRIEVQRGDGSMSQGTGFVVDAPRGLVATNHHVVAGATQITVTLPGGKKIEPARIGGLQSSEDLVVLALPTQLEHALELRTNPPPQPGEDVFALGHPLGLANTVTEGIVSGLREVEGRRMIQTSAAISAGNSGGPLVDREGRAVGIVTWKVSAVSVEGLAFATAAESLREILEPSALKAVPIDEYYAGMSVRGEADTARWHASPNASLGSETDDLAGTWKPGRSPVLYVALAPDGPNRFLGSLVRIDGGLKVLKQRILETPAIKLRRDFLLSRTPEGWSTEFGWIWECRPAGVSRRADGTYGPEATRSCYVPTGIDVKGAHGNFLRVTVTQPSLPSERDRDYAQACETCLSGATPQVIEADFERTAKNVVW